MATPKRWPEEIALALSLLALAACAGGENERDRTEEKGPAGAATDPALAKCAEGLEAAAEMETAPAMMLAEACAGACGGFAELPKVEPSRRRLVLIDQCSYVCPGGARAVAEAAPPDFGLEAVRACGEEHYGLTEEKAGFLSPAWFVVHRIGRWLESERDGAGDAIGDRLDAALAAGVEVELPVPLRLPGIVRLPGGERTDPAFSADALLRVSKDELRLGAPPRARLVLGGAELEEGALTGEVLAEGAELTLRAAPLLVADRSLPAAALVPVLEALEETGARLALEGSGGAAAHRVELLAEEAKEELVLERGSVSATRDREIWRHPLADPEALARELRAREPGEAVAVSLSRKKKPTVADLATLLDALAGAGARRAMLQDGSARERIDEAIEEKAVLRVLTSEEGAGRYDVIEDPDRGADLDKAIENVKKSGAQVSGSGSPALRGTIDLADLEAGPAIDGDAARRALKLHLRSMHRCYHDRLAKKPKLAGTVELAVTVQANGRPGDINASGLDRALERCLEKRALRFRFPPPKGKEGASVQATLRLAPKP